MRKLINFCLALAVIGVLLPVTNADSDDCNRGEVWSYVNPNKKWKNTTTYHPQVWYHTLEEIHKLWKLDYFDYVLDVRGVDDVEFTDGEDTSTLEGWETMHIPGSYVTDLRSSYDKPVEDTTMLVDFTSSVCKDSRIFIHCWNGAAANVGAERLIALDFTNVHAAGPEGSAGIWAWRDAGYEITYNDKFDPDRVPPCETQDLCTLASTSPTADTPATGTPTADTPTTSVGKKGSHGESSDSHGKKRKEKLHDNKSKLKQVHEGNGKGKERGLRHDI